MSEYLNENKTAETDDPVCPIIPKNDWIEYLQQEWGLRPNTDAEPTEAPPTPPSSTP